MLFSTTCKRTDEKLSIGLLSRTIKVTIYLFILFIIIIVHTVQQQVLLLLLLLLLLNSKENITTINKNTNNTTATITQSKTLLHSLKNSNSRNAYKLAHRSQWSGG